MLALPSVRNLVWSLLLVLAAPNAHAKTNIAVLGVEAVGVSPSVAARFSAALKEHVQRTPGYLLVAGKSLAETKLVFGCINESARCMGKVGKSLSAHLLVWGRVEKRRPGGVKLTLHVLDVNARKFRKGLQKAFSARQAAAPEARVLALAAKIIPAQTATLRLRCAVEGAQVLLDDRPVGIVDVRGVLVIPNVPTGSAQVEVRRSGFRPFTRSITFVAGTTVDLVVKLVARLPKPNNDVIPEQPQKKLTFDEPKEEKGSPAWRIVFYSGLAATVGLGIGLIVNGLEVVSLGEDKNAAIYALLEQYGETEEIKTLGNDGCNADANILGKYPELDNLCRDGFDRATVENILVGATVGVGVLTVVAAYFAFFSSSESPDGESSEDSSESVSWHVAPSVGPTGAGLGFTLNF